MTTELFQPLGMSTAGFGAPGSASDVEEPWGHTDSSGQRVASKGDNTPGLGPAGRMHASLQDWADGAARAIAACDIRRLDRPGAAVGILDRGVHAI